MITLNLKCRTPVFRALYVPSTEAGRGIVKKRRYHYDFFYLKEIIRLDLTSRNSSRVMHLSAKRGNVRFRHFIVLFMLSTHTREVNSVTLLARCL